MPILIILLIVVIVFVYVKRKKLPEGKGAKEYAYTKKCLMTPIEKKFFEAIKNSVSINYTVQPQINLATIVKKQGDFKYQNELYRNIDFGVFDDTYNIVLLIEINDETHSDPKRRKRDARVKEICDMAQIPLVTFHTKYGVNQEYVSKRIREHIH